MLTGCTPWPAEFIERYLAEGFWGTETLGSLPSRWVRRPGADDRVAVVDGDRRIGYRELEQRCGRLAGGLRSAGVGPGDHVVVQLPNGTDLIVACLALFRIAARPVLALPQHRRADLEHLFATSGATTYLTAGRIAGFDHRGLARKLCRSVPSLRRVVVAADDPAEFVRLSDLDDEPPPDLAQPDDVALFLLSGGTRGRPKLIPRTHRDYVYNLRASSANARLSADDVYLAALPIAHNYALACPGVLGTLDAGGTVVVPPTASPEDAFELIARERVTVTGLVPSLATLWARFADGADLSSLRLVQIGGSKLTTEAARQVGPALGGARIQQSFGMAEGLLSQSPPEDSDELRDTTQGRPISPADEVRIVDEDGRDVPEGAVGRLLTRGPYTIRGYFDAADYNATAFTPDGFLRTGDLVRRLPSGHLVVTGRVDDLIVRGGDKIAPDEVEDHLVAHSDVLEVVVTGMTDRSLGERACAWVVAGDPDLTLRDLVRFLTDRGLAAYKIPERLELLETLPRTGVGKIDRSLLRTWADR